MNKNMDGPLQSNLGYVESAPPVGPRSCIFTSPPGDSGKDRKKPTFSEELLERFQRGQLVGTSSVCLRAASGVADLPVILEVCRLALAGHPGHCGFRVLAGVTRGGLHSPFSPCSQGSLYFNQQWS